MVLDLSKSSIIKEMSAGQRGSVHFLRNKILTQVIKLPNLKSKYGPRLISISFDIALKYTSFNMTNSTFSVLPDFSVL